MVQKYTCYTQTSVVDLGDREGSQAVGQPTGAAEGETLLHNAWES